MTWRKGLLIMLALLVCGAIGIGWYFTKYAGFDIYVPQFASHCAGCHGADLQGTDTGPALVGTPLRGGDLIDDLQHSIKTAHLDFAPHDFSDELSDVDIKGLAIYVGERRLGQRFAEFQFDRAINAPAEVQDSEVHNFRLEPFATGLAPLVFSIHPLPDGSMLLTEKERGLSLISADGQQSDLLEGTPQTGSSVDILGIQYGSGWLLDVATHPNYQENGWVYLHYTHLCGDACGSSLMDASMNRIDRGRIRDGRWTDVETIWQAPAEFYVATPDTGAGGRIAFDDAGHLYFSVGIKSADGTSDVTAQDLAQPYGKIHRVNDDGSIPLDNPFATANVNTTGTAPPMPSIWTYGHRSPQGLEWHPVRQRAWNSEMGPRGGDELNELLPGRNYGWPYFSRGLEYSGTEVERHKLKGTEFAVSDVEQTLVDITPSPAISSFVVYSGAGFPRWQNNVLIGSLKGNSLYRMVFEGRELTHRETLIKDLARIRDIEVGYDGLVYLLLETKTGSSVLRMVPG